MKLKLSEECKLTKGRKGGMKAFSRVFLQSFAGMGDTPKMIRNLKSLKPLVSATPAHPKGNRCSRKTHFLLIIKQGFTPKPESKLTTLHGDLKNSHYSFSVSQLGCSSIWGRTNLGCRTVPCPEAPKG